MEGRTDTVAAAQEMGFLLLQDCPIEVLRSGRCRRGAALLPVGQEQALEWVTVVPRHHDDSTKPNMPDACDGVCRRCHFVVVQKQRHDSNTNGETSTLSMDWDAVPPFFGTVQDVRSVNKALPVAATTPSCTSSGSGRYSCSCCCQEGSGGGGKRSDAALVAGLLVACRDVVQVITCKILVAPRTTDEPTTASILLTLAFPHLSAANRSILAAPANKRTRATKHLHAALQLLLSLVRSDWRQFDSILQQPQLLLKKQHEKKPAGNSFFPSKLTLGEIYKRIQGGSRRAPLLNTTTTVDRGGRGGTGKENQTRDCTLAYYLPDDLLVEKMAPFMDAQSLGALRSCCTYMYNIMIGVVPGLKLRLYSHQVSSLSWMRQRESSLISTEEDCLNGVGGGRGDACTDDDMHRAITGGATVRLAVKPNPDQGKRSANNNTGGPESNCSWHIHINPCTGREMDVIGTCLPRHVARGGILADDPGLGKTVTVLALMLQTRGIKTATRSSSSSSSSPKATPQEDDDSTKNGIGAGGKGDDAIFQAYWSEQVVSDFRRPELLRLLNELAKRTRVNVNFPFGVLKQAIAKDEYGGNFFAFERAVEDLIEKYAETLSVPFKEIIRDFKATQIRSARKSFSNPKSKPNSHVAALIEQEGRERLLDSLVPSAGTLLVIPSVLMEHWKAQIQLHVDLRYCTDKIPLIFEYEKKDSGMTVDKVTILCQLHKTHAPVIFLDRAGTRPLPPANFLAMFDIVITTNQRFMNEWKKGSFEDELDRDNSEVLVSRLNLTRVNVNSVDACELLKVNWFRMVVDEGHSMGNDKTNSSIQFASWINAQRRWAMTGTPTKQSSVQIGQLRGLVRFLQHDFFTSRLEGDVFWKRNIARSWRDGELVSFFRLRSLLGFLMKRHTKQDIAELPPPVYSKSAVAMSFLEATTYNTLVCAVQANLLLTSMNGKTSGFQDSLLHRSQAKNARLALQNIRRVCTGWSRVVPTLTNRWYRETLRMAEAFGLSEAAIAEIRNFMHRAETEQLSACSYCGMQLSTLVLMNCCGGTICTECMDSSTPVCFLCEDVFDVDQLQKFQPGFVLDWKSNLELKLNKVSAQAGAENSANGPGPVVIDLAGQRNNETGEGRPEHGPLLRPPGEPGRRRKKYGDGHACEYDIYSATGKCVYCFEEHNFCNLLNARSRCEQCHRVAEICPTDESKSFYLSARLLELHKAQPTSVRLGDDGATLTCAASRPLKVIVFSQFRAALNFVGDRLLRRFGTACIAEYFGRHRKQELHKFTHESSCFCLLLTKDGAEGLDLSFVTNIVFLEEIYDTSLQEQAVARAWRMGATGSVQVETLIASNTVEEVMGKLNSRREEDNTLSSGKGADQQRMKSLLESLRFVTDYHHFAKGDEAIARGGEASTASPIRPKRSLPLSEASEREPPPKRAKPATATKRSKAMVRFDIPACQGRAT